MRHSGPVPAAAARAAGQTQRQTGEVKRMSQAKHPTAAPAPDLPAEARGRRILSTALVRMGAGEQLTVELRDGRVLVLRDLVMRRSDYCGVEVRGGAAVSRHCGGYAEVAAARAGRPPTPAQPGPGVLDPEG